MVNSGRCTVRRWLSSEHTGNIELEILAGGKQTLSEEPQLLFKVVIGDINSFATSRNSTTPRLLYRSTSA
ncbi:hypothetical protein Y032_0024g945 [Ancylostoma ceylanicum]|uniref:Uncharacterized protein n=1 Tax=Ancylostoma ceylanicum TaxID=53326 RepID=A0A016UX61_9BILA|nr:hypothetical protein Y032_0024g945 [Ancylostoma ceylanicum]